MDHFAAFTRFPAGLMAEMCLAGLAGADRDRSLRAADRIKLHHVLNREPITLPATESREIGQ